MTSHQAAILIILQLWRRPRSFEGNNLCKHLQEI
uniref:Uncharacterized protein n=1 Tax=Anguilla anguilla TaxID=7936 RepID=A0A0E9TRV6_ANGAN